MNIRGHVARAWHEGSDHAKDGTPFGGPLCNCDQVAGRIMPMLRDAWQEGWAGRASRPHLGMYECIPAPDHINPYRNGEDRHADQ